MNLFLALTFGLLPLSPLLAQTPDYFGTTGPAGSPAPPTPTATPEPIKKSLPPPIREACTKFEAAMSRIDAEETARLNPAKAACLQELVKLRDATRSQGSVSDASEIDAAIKAVQAGTAQPTPKTVVPSLQRVLESYRFNAAPILKQFGEQRSRLSADFARAMDELEQGFTRAGNLEGAQQAHLTRLDAPAGFTVDVMPVMTGGKVERGGFTVVKDKIATTAKFRPPLEIEYTFMTETQVRVGFAADQIIFNWEVNRDELRIDGGPVSGQHRKGAGRIPTKQIVQIKQVVTPNRMTLFVDGRERVAWDGDFTGVNDSISVRSLEGVTSVKQVTAKKLR